MATEEEVEEEVDDAMEVDANKKEQKGDAPPQKPTQKRAKARRQSGTAVAFQKRSSVRNLPERTTSSHKVERKGKNDLADLMPPSKPDRRGSHGEIKKATSAMRAARGVPTSRGVSRATSSQNAPRRPDRAVAPVQKKVPARSSSTHSLKPFRKDRTTEVPTLTGADLLNLRTAQKADMTDADSVQSDMESTYTMDSINLRKSQIHHNPDEGKSQCLRSLADFLGFVILRVFPLINIWKISLQILPKNYEILAWKTNLNRSLQAL